MNSLSDEIKDVKKVIVLLAHYDDELFLFPWFKELSLNNREIELIWLTDSGGLNEKKAHYLPEIRKIESLKFLKNLNFNNYLIHHIGIENNFKDGKLHEFLIDTEKLILNSWGGEKVVFVTPAFENGHLDHDSVFVLAKKLALKYENNSGVLSFPLYSPGKLLPFKVLNPKMTKRDVTYFEKKLNFKEFLLIVKAPLIYKTQLRTWLGIYIPLIFKILIVRKFYLIKSDDLVNYDYKIDDKIMRHRNKSDIAVWSKKIKEYLS